MDWCMWTTKDAVVFQMSTGPSRLLFSGVLWFSMFAQGIVAIWLL